MYIDIGGYPDVPKSVRLGTLDVEAITDTGFVLRVSNVEDFPITVSCMDTKGNVVKKNCPANGTVKIDYA